MRNWPNCASTSSLGRLRSGQQSRDQLRSEADNFDRSDPDIRKLDVERQRLDDAWTQFRHILPPDARVELARRPVEFQDVVSVMKGIENEWQQKKEKGAWGSTKKYFRRVSNTLHSHSTLLQVLPADSQYASIFCGTLQSLIKVRLASSKCKVRHSSSDSAA